MTNRTGWRCLDCRISTRQSGEYYMVHTELWDSVVTGDGMLCIGCLEDRLKRPLTQADFTTAPVNQNPLARRSERLTTLLGDTIASAEAWAQRKRGQGAISH